MDLLWGAFCTPFVCLEGIVIANQYKDLLQFIIKPYLRAMEYLLVADSLSRTRKLASLQFCSWASASWRLTLPWYQLKRQRENYITLLNPLWFALPCRDEKREIKIDQTYYQISIWKLNPTEWLATNMTKSSLDMKMIPM